MVVELGKVLMELPQQQQADLVVVVVDLPQLLLIILEVAVLEQMVRLVDMVVMESA